MNVGKILMLILFALLASLAFYYFYPEKSLPVNVMIDRLVVFKSKRELLAYANGQLIKTYKIA